MKKFVLTPVQPEDETFTPMMRVPKPFPTTKKRDLVNKIQEIEAEIRKVLKDPKMSTTEKLLRHGALLASYKEAHDRLNQPKPPPPVSSEPIAPLPEESDEEEVNEEDATQWSKRLFSFLTTPKHEADVKEEDNTERLMNMLFTPPSREIKKSPKTPVSATSSRYHSTASDVNTPTNQFSPSLSFQQTPTLLPIKEVRQQSLAGIRAQRGAKPVNRLTYSRLGVQRTTSGNGRFRLRLL